MICFIAKNIRSLVAFVARARCQSSMILPEAAVQRHSQEKVFRKYAANLQENAHADVRFQ